jgi:hypothetical protein
VIRFIAFGLGALLACGCGNDEPKKDPNVPPASELFDKKGDPMKKNDPVLKRNDPIRNTKSKMD